MLTKFWYGKELSGRFFYDISGSLKDFKRRRVEEGRRMWSRRLGENERRKSPKEEAVRVRVRRREARKGRGKGGRQAAGKQ